MSLFNWKYLGIIPSSSIDPQLAQRVRVTLTSAQILALFTTAQTLIAAPGAGKYISIDEIVATLNAGASAYTGSNALNITYQNAGGSAATAALPSAWLDSASSRCDKVTPVTVAAIPVNQPIVASIGTANPAAGNGTISFDISYRIVQIP